MSRADSDAAGEGMLAYLRARIGRDGPLTVAQYMQICLEHPEHGYWQAADSIGKTGDFVTAPEISQIFGELIGLWCVLVWERMGRPPTLRLIELGPGRGTLMQDALRAARVSPAYLERLSVHLVEASPHLRQVQQRLLAPPSRSDTKPIPMAWHDRLEDAPEGPAIIIANEFLDALPIRQLVRSGGAWHERVVDLDPHGRLRFAIGAAVPDTGSHAPPDGTILDLREGEGALLGALRARSQPLVALFVDYGPADAAYGDTLQAVHRHAYVDPLSAPGLADVTAHAQLAGFAAKARAVGLAADGPITQAQFLGALGVVERASRLMTANARKAHTVEAGVQRLMSPTGMGELFKVLAIRSSTLPSPPPFD